MVAARIVVMATLGTCRARMRISGMEWLNPAG